MQETPKEKSKIDKAKEARDEASWGEDQQTHGYYYDDAHGYEVYRPDEDDDDQSDANHSDQQKGAVSSDDPQG